MSCAPSVRAASYEGGDTMAKELLRMEGITKIYGNGFMANKDISFSVNEGEIHALIGENGAGKTTLMKILFGLENCQEGKIFIEGKECHIANPLDAIDKGVGMVHQHFMLIPKPDGDGEYHRRTGDRHGLEGGPEEGRGDDRSAVRAVRTEDRSQQEGGGFIRYGTAACGDF